MLAEEIVFFRRGKSGVSVSPAHETELEGVCAKRRLELQSLGQGLAGILMFKHAGLLRHTREIGGVPFLEIGKFIVG